MVVSARVYLDMLRPPRRDFDRTLGVWVQRLHECAVTRSMQSGSMSVPALSAPSSPSTFSCFWFSFEDSELTGLGSQVLPSPLSAVSPVVVV